MSWRVTHTKQDRKQFDAIDQKTGVVKKNVLLKAQSNIELRENDGTILRLKKGSEFELKESPLGLRPEYFGEILISKKGGCGKYRTSCWLKEANPLSERPDIFIKPGDKPYTDEFYALCGDVIIYEIDETGKTFTICTVNEGEKAIVFFDNNTIKMKDKYKATVMPFTDKEYEYILNNYIDSRNWK